MVDATGTLDPAAPDLAPRTTGTRDGGITTAGLVFMGAALVAFAFAGYLLNDHPRAGIKSYVPELIMTGIGMFAALLGVKLVRAGGLSPSDPLPVVNPVEWQLLSAKIGENTDDPIGQFIRLSSLTGATGLFTKLGLSGLPLATICLTLFFAVVAIIEPPQTKFIELTQLTLGAFIGSFVQKQVVSLRDAGMPAKPPPHPVPDPAAPVPRR